jgi:hypothetical protein
MSLPRPPFTLRRLMVAVALAAVLGLAPPEPIRIGQIAPPVVALTAGGDFGIESYYRGRYVILAFWSMKDAAGLRQFEQLRKIRLGMAKEERLLIVDVCADDGETDHDTWLEFLKIQGKPDYGDSDGRGPVRFYSDRKWVNTFQGGSDFVSTKAYGVERLPAAFLIGPDRRLLAVRIPIDKLGEVVAEALKKTR